jgi:hypothetical protein
MLLSIAPGAGPCGIPFGWCDMALFDIISTHEITVNIIQYLITIYITMIVGAGTLDGNHTSLAQKNRSQKQMFQMFDGPVAVDERLLLVQNYEC